MCKDTQISMSKEDQHYIYRCLELAKKGLFQALPNPSVGAVIVHQGKIIGQGATAQYGGPHAEVQAIASVKDKSLLKQATLYVSLEPCSHHGKTPPCADLIIQTGIPKVVIGAMDPFSEVCGKGIEKLTNAGIEVTVGVLQELCLELNKRFTTLYIKKRPYIILKWAQSADAFIAPEKSQEKQVFWISNAYSQQLVHKWRSEEKAFLVGKTTAISDNPSLTTRGWFGANPLRIYIDPYDELTDDYHLKDLSSPTLCFTSKSNTVDQENLKYISIDLSKPLSLQIAQQLYRLKVASVVIEGGQKTLQDFIDQDLWDEARIFSGNSLLHRGVKAPYIKKYSKEKTFKIDSDLLTIKTK